MRHSKRNISNAFGASLACGFQKEAADYSLSKVDTRLEKYAGIPIYNPTEENIEDFVRKYIMNEMSGTTANTSVSVPISIGTQTYAYENEESQRVDEASGMITLKYLGKDIEIPFMISEGELVPFDVIQMDGQRVPYSRENLAKILNGMLSQKEENDKADNPYLGLDDPKNPSTASSFLGNVLQIRDSERHVRQPDGNNFVYASTLDDWIEKVSNLPEMTEKHFDELEKHLTKKASEEMIRQMEEMVEKVAGDDMEELSLFEKIKELNFVDANGLEHGQVIMFPERSEHEVGVTYGIVLNRPLKINHNKNAFGKFLMTQDGRIKRLDKKDRVMVLKVDEDVPFRFEHTSLSKLKDGEAFVVLKGDDVLGPVIHKHTSDRSFNGAELNDGTTAPFFESKVMVNVLADTENDLLGNIDNINDNFGVDRFRVPMVAADGAELDLMPYEKMVQLKKKESGIDSEYSVHKVLSKGHVVCRSEKNEMSAVNGQSPAPHVILTDPDTKVVKVTGVLRDFLRTPDDLDKVATIALSDNAFEKQAAAEKNKVKVVCRDRTNEVFDIEIKFVDKSFKIPSQKQRDVNGLEWQSSMDLLKVIGFSGVEATEILKKAKREPKAVYALPENHNADVVSEGQVRSVALNKAKNTMKNVAKPSDIAMAASFGASAKLLSDAITSSPETVQDVAGSLLAFADESKVLSGAFEKIAMEYESYSALSVAKIMAAAAHLYEKTASAVNGKVYPRLSDVSADIIRENDILEKTAYDLMDLKVSQLHHKREMVNPAYIHGAVKHLDQFHKLAYNLADLKKGV